MIIIIPSVEAINLIIIEDIYTALYIKKTVIILRVASLKLNLGKSYTVREKYHKFMHSKFLVFRVVYFFLTSYLCKYSHY